MRSRIGAVASLGIAAMLLGLVLVLPNRPSAMGWDAFARLPLELPALLGLLIVAGARPGAARLVRGVFALILIAILLLKVADYTLFEAFSRSFNPVTDVFVFSAGANLLLGSLGPVLGVGALAGIVLANLLAAAGLFWALRRWSRPGTGPAIRAGAGSVAIVFAALTALDASHRLNSSAVSMDPPGTANTTIFAMRHAERARGAARDLAAYRIAAETDPFAAAPGLFGRLEKRDVIVVFIESYGRSSFDSPFYAETHLPTLRAAEEELAEEGLGTRSLWLTSPIAGGQSWLAHGTFASGLRTADQARYGAMLASPRRTLYHLAQNAGYRTAAVVPAITLPWPEGPLLGFETILAAADLDYAGDPFNWVTMPDQYTLSAYPDLLGDDPRPDFLEIALISSHAPWVPIPPLIDWDAIGDGSVFNRWANSGDPPRVVWKDRDRVRLQYRLAVDYSLQTVLSFAARQAGPDGPLIIVLGDHQPAPWVAQIESRDVPIHLIGPPEVLALFDDWYARPGLVPDVDTPVWPMEAFRDRFLEAVSGPAAEGEAS